MSVGSFEMIWSVLRYKRRSVIPQRRVGSGFIWATASIRLQPKRKRQKGGRWRDDGQRHCVISRALNWWVLGVSSAATLLCFFRFFFNRHQLSSPGPCRHGRPCWRRLLRRDTWGAPATFADRDGGGTGRRDCGDQAPQTHEVWGKCLRGRLLQDAIIICLPRPLPWERGCFHAPSPPALRFLCLTVWWPIPWPPGPVRETEEERVSGVKGQMGGLHWVLPWCLHHLAGVDRNGFRHQPLEIAAQTDTFHADESLLSQHCPEGAYMEQDNQSHHSLQYTDRKTSSWGLKIVLLLRILWMWFVRQLLVHWHHVCEGDLKGENRNQYWKHIFKLYTGVSFYFFPMGSRPHWQLS